MTEHLVDNKGVRIHAIELNSSATGVPIVIVPGMINSAEEVLESVGNHLKRRAIIVSIRGRGKSDSPATGWRLEDQASDVAAVVNHFTFPEIVLFGHSTGGTFAARAIPMVNANVAAMILGDFPPFYPPYSENWRKHVLEDATEILISDAALQGIVAEAQYTDVREHLASVSSNLFVITGDPEQSLFKSADLEPFQKLFPLAAIERLTGCSHEFLSDNPALATATLERIAAIAESRKSTSSA